MSTLPPPGNGELRQLVRLAVPVVFVQLGLMLLSTVDVVMVGHLSAEALAAVTIGRLCFWTLIVFGKGVLMALDPLVSQAVAAGDHVAVARAVQRGLVLAAALAVPISLLLLPVGPALRWLGQPPEVIPMAVEYAHASIPAALAFLLFTVLQHTLQAFSCTRPIVVVIVLGNVVNLVLDYAFVFGELGAPALGVAGAAWATVGCQWLMAVALLLLASPRLWPALWPWRQDAMSLRPLGRMLRLGAPIGAQYVLELGAFAATALLMGRLGTTAQAGHQVAINLASLSFMVPLGVASAAAVRTGYAVGRGDAAAARRAAGTALCVGAAVMAVFGALFLAWPAALAALYTDQAAVLAVAATLIPIAGLFQVFDGLQVVAVGVLRGLGDTRTPLVVNLLGFWLVGVPLGLVVAFRLDGGPAGLWWGLVAGLGVVAGVLLVRVRRQLRGEVARLVVDAPSPPDGGVAAAE